MFACRATRPPRGSNPPEVARGPGRLDAEEDDVRGVRPHRVGRAGDAAEVVVGLRHAVVGRRHHDECVGIPRDEFRQPQQDAGGRAAIRRLEEDLAQPGVIESLDVRAMRGIDDRDAPIGRRQRRQTRDGVFEQRRTAVDLPELLGHAAGQLRQPAP